MGDKSSIEWTDATWNPVAGCSILSPGCTNCYAMKMAHRIEAMQKGLGKSTHYASLTMKTKAGAVWTGKLAEAPDEIFGQPLRWKRPRRIFVNSMSDLFHDDVPQHTIDRVFAIMACCPQHSFQVLTKRSARMRAYVGDSRIRERVLFEQWPLPNVWLGVSVEDQARADERIPDLLATPAAVRFLSCEPLLGPIDLRNHRVCNSCENTPYRLFKNDPLCPDPMPAHDSFQCPLHWWPSDGCDGVLKSGIDWVIAGGESGQRARPMHPDWARSLRDQCQAAGIPYHFKQWGEHAPSADHDPAACQRMPIALHVSGRREYRPTEELRLLASQAEGWAGMCKVGKKAAGAMLDGREWREFPT